MHRQFEVFIDRLAVVYNQKAPDKRALTKMQKTLEVPVFAFTTSTARDAGNVDVMKDSGDGEKNDAGDVEKKDAGGEKNDEGDGEKKDGGGEKNDAGDGEKKNEGVEKNDAGGGEEKENDEEKDNNQEHDEGDGGKKAANEDPDEGEFEFKDTETEASKKKLHDAAEAKKKIRRKLLRPNKRILTRQRTTRYTSSGQQPISRRKRRQH
jgi:hypothetical protein